MAADFTVRGARPADASEIAEIYGRWVRTSAASFEHTPPSAEEMAARIAATLERYPYLVAVDGEGAVAGFCYASALRGRAAYDWSAETTIYLREDARGASAAHLLYSRLEDLLRAQGVCNLYACITDPNPASQRFHEKCGYVKVGSFSDCGYKLGRWWSITWWEKVIARHPLRPAALIAYPDLPERKESR